MKIKLFTSTLLIALLTGCGSSGNECCVTSTTKIEKDQLGIIAPTAVISKLTNNTFQTKEVITLDALPSTDVDGTIVNYEWGNGTQVEHGITYTTSFDTVGEKTIYLTVTDDDGLTNTTQITINIEAPNTQSPKSELTTPIAVITQPDSAIYRFSCEESYDQDENGDSIKKCEWHTKGFDKNGKLIKEDKGTIDENSVTIHPCTGRSSYAIITLTVTDDENETNTVTKRVEFK